MDPVLKAVLTSWDWRVDILLVLALAGTLYLSGWWRLRKRAKPSPEYRNSRPYRTRGSSLSAGWRPIAYSGGLLVVGLALLSPIDVLAGQLFAMHMVQHLLLIMIAPPLLLLANPLPFVLWGLPSELRRKTGRFIAQLLAGDAPFRQKLRTVTAPGMTWMIWVIAILGWHDPGAYDLALRNELAHDLEHLSFFLAGMLYWWHVIGAGPRIHKQFGHIGRIAFVLSVIPPNMAAGVAIAFATQPIYAYTAGFLGLSALQDQQLGGMIMWIPGSMMYIVAALILAGQVLKQEQLKPPLPESKWGTDEALAAPGLEKTG